MARCGCCGDEFNSILIVGLQRHENFMGLNRGMLLLSVCCCQLGHSETGSSKERIFFLGGGGVEVGEGQSERVTSISMKLQYIPFTVSYVLCLAVSL